MKKSFLLLATFAVAQIATTTALTAPALAQIASNLVVSGQSLGKIRLGMSTAQVQKLLGKPDQSLRLRNGLTDDLYRAKKTRINGDGFTVRDKVEVLYKAGRVVQIEATSPTFRTATGLSTASPLKVLNRLLNPKLYMTYDYGGEAVGGYFQYYLDHVQSGIAFESGPHQDNWFWDRGSETLIVHRKGVPVVPDQGGIFYSSTAHVPPEDQ